MSPVVAVAVALVLMGRPVVKDKSLAELAADAELVLEVEKASPFTASRKNAEGCEEALWRVVVKQVLRQKRAPDAPEPLRTGETVEVIVNPTALFDCMARTHSPSGVSFSAPRYTPAAAEPGLRFLLFVNKGKRGYIVSVESAWDVLEQKPKLPPP